MSPDENVLGVVREWVDKAENDLRTASYTLTMPEDCPTDTVCFHVQQCVEKYSKALLTLRGTEYPQTHSIDILVSLLPPVSRPDLSADEQDRLTEYATVTRYPGNYEPISLTEAEEAVEMAHRFRESIRKRLPEDILKSPDQGR